MIRLILWISIALSLASQTPDMSISAMYMGRGEYRHGYRMPAEANQDPAMFITQRFRLMSRFTYQQAELGLNIQDVRVWGAATNLAPDNNGFLSVHEAWIKLPIGTHAKATIGRQELVYDESRMLGNVGWTMQARRHDAAVISYALKDTWRIDIGAAFNQERESLSGSNYLLAGNYKTLQFAYYLQSFDDVNVSFLGLNTGFEYTDASDSLNVKYRTVFSQTVGPRIWYQSKDNPWSWSFAAYVQTGSDDQDRPLSAYDILAEISHQLNPSFKITVGGEILSGISEFETGNENTAFTPLFGTNHRFNGYMDLFYVGNHNRSVGLNDFYIKGIYKTGNWWTQVSTHVFSAANDIVNDANPSSAADTYLGTEVDLTLSYKLDDNVALQFGYSQLFAGKSFGFLRNIADIEDQTHNWAYLMIVFHPSKAWPKVGLKL